MKFLFVLTLIGSTPFVMWRVPHFEPEPKVIIGEVDHKVIDHAPDWKHQLRTPFEGMFGNRPVTLVDGTRIYVTPPDYDEVWPETWGEMYEKGYSIRITAQADKLLFGGLTVATITDTERVTVSRPIADAHRDKSPAPRRRGRSTSRRR